MKVAALIQWFEVWANPAWQESWDNCGWQVEPGVLNQDACVLVCLTPTLAVMREATHLRERGIPVNLIFAHHPLLFSPLKSLQTGHAIADQIRLAYTYEIGIYTAHTNFDQAENGTADVLAQVLGLQDCQPLTSTQSGLGYGRVGSLMPTQPLSDFLKRVQTALQSPDLIYSPTVDLDHPIQRVAVLGGSGASYLAAAANAGVDAYVTSDCKFHQFQESRDRGVILIDAGHYATERPACERLVTLMEAFGVAWVALSQQDEDFRNFHQASCFKH
jgi:dinuclear metal center YbgI/SA1388 family protein